MSQLIRFCEDCDNKYYHMIENDELLYFCRVCGKKDASTSKTSHCVLNIAVDNKSSQPLEHLVHKYTKYDPTLPHIFVPCPRETCPTNKESHKETHTDAVYIRYDNIHMRHLYICTKCDFVWSGGKSE